MGRKKKVIVSEVADIQTTFSDVDLDELLEDGEGVMENVYSANDETGSREQELHND